MNETKTIEQLNSEEVSRLTPLLIYLGIIATTGIPGNIIVCLVYWVKSKKSVPKFFMWWLAVIDIISCFVLSLELWNVVHQHTYTNTLLCKLTIFFTIWPVITSAFGLCLISFDRFQRVCKPLQKKISHKKAKCMCLATVGVALAFSWPSLILFGTYTTHIPDYNLTSSTCSIQNEYQGTTYDLIYNGFLCILFLCVLIFLVVFYIIIGAKICKQMGRNFSATSNEHHDKSNDIALGDTISTGASSTAVKLSQSSSLRQAKAKKSSFIMFLISFVFVVSFLPYLILRMIEAFDPTFVHSMTDIGRACHAFFLRTYFLNCVINPFIYCACAAKFRQDVRTYFGCNFRKSRYIQNVFM